MGFIFMLIMLGMFVTYVVYHTYSNENKPDDIAYRPTAVKNSILTCGIISTVIVLIILSITWETYTGLKSKQVTMNQYRSAIQMYVANTNVPTGVKGKLISDLTDRKYDGYQLRLHELITRYRRAVIIYNSTLIEKTIYNDSWFFGWVTIGPDANMKPASMDISKLHKTSI